jgi:hypothetical protein
MPVALPPPRHTPQILHLKDYRGSSFRPVHKSSLNSTTLVPSKETDFSDRNNSLVPSRGNPFCVGHRKRPPGQSRDRLDPVAVADAGHRDPCRRKRNDSGHARGLHGRVRRRLDSLHAIYAGNDARPGRSEGAWLTDLIFGRHQWTRHDCSVSNALLVGGDCLRLGHASAFDCGTALSH